MTKYFICPHCKSITGWQEITPVHGHYSMEYNENGEFLGAGYADSMNYYYNSTTYECRCCKRNIKGAVLRYKKGEEK